MPHRPFSKGFVAFKRQSLFKANHMMSESDRGMGGNKREIKFTVTESVDTIRLSTLVVRCRFMWAEGSEALLTEYSVFFPCGASVAGR
jgi:hypothetical protein